MKRLALGLDIHFSIYTLTRSHSYTHTTSIYNESCSCHYDQVRSLSVLLMGFGSFRLACVLAVCCTCCCCFVRLSFLGIGFFFFAGGLFRFIAWLAMSSRNARKPSWACEASFRARERMQARYWSVESRWPGPPEHTWKTSNERCCIIIAFCLMMYC